MSPSALDVLRSLHHHCTGAGLPPPAAPIGSWYGADAVIARRSRSWRGWRRPTILTGSGSGYLGFPVNASKAPFPTAAGGLVDGVLLLRDGQWSWTDVTGADAPDWVTGALRWSGPDDGGRVTARHERSYRDPEPIAHWQNALGAPPR